MLRRDFLRYIGFSAGISVFSDFTLADLRTVKQPNILIIHVDQHRIDCLGAYGNKDINTPHIDRLAADGVRYDNSFCPYPVCTPSRYSLLSGQYVHDHRSWNNRSTLSPKIATFPRILRSAGYRTKAVGKMHFLPTYLDVGFSEMILAEQDGPGRWDDDYHRYLAQQDLVDRNDLEDQRSEYRKNAPPEYWKTYGSLVSNLPEKHHSTTWIAEKAIETIQSWSTQGGQLLMVGFIKPHHPFDPPAPWDTMYDPDTLSILPGWTDACFEHDLKYNRGYFPHDKLNKPTLRKVMASYYASISQIDHHVGRIVDMLQKKGIYENTLIVYTADHGDYMGHHHMLLKGNHMYDPLVKVPLVIKWPGNKHAGTVSHNLVNNIDLAPTLCCAAGCKPGSDMHGCDLRDTKAGGKYVFAESRNGQEVMVRTKTRKLILTPGSLKNLFFDLEKDPLEMKNLYGSLAYQEEIKKLESILVTWRCNESRPKPYADQNAPQIGQPNVPSSDLSHRPEIIEYYQKKMYSLQKSASKTVL